MIKQKQYQWQRQIRREQIETMKQVCRQRKKMMEQLEQIIETLSQCSLYSGREQLLAHKCFFDCEAFAIGMHERLFTVIVKIGTEWCKKLIIDKGLPGILSRVAIAIQNKVILPQQDQQNKQFYSREKVLNSISRILCVFTEDNDLIGSYGQFISSMLITSIRYECFLQADETHKDHLIAILNLFYYEDHQQLAYSQLRNINFQVVFQRYLLAIVDNRVNPADIDVNHFKLFRKYVKYQIDDSEYEMSRRMLMNMADFLTYIFDSERKDFLGIFRSEVVEEILKICTLLNFKGEICLVVLKNTDIYSYLAYSQLLNTWTYNNSFISVNDFTCSQLVEILQALSRTEKATEDIHAQKLAASLANLLYNSDLDGESIGKVRRCLKESQTYDLLCDSQRSQQGFKQLCQVMSTIPQDDI